MKKKGIIFISALMILITGLVIYSQINEKSNDLIQPLAGEGYLDLTRFNFKNNGTIRLDGDWEFYWNQFISPGEFERDEKSRQLNWIHVPTRWNKQPPGIFHLSGCSNPKTTALKW